MAGAFQDFFRFEFRAGQTVGLGDVPRVDSEPALTTAIDRAGAADVVTGLPAGLRTQLGPTWPGGVDVSYGQWQKLALARGFMRDEPLVAALDEPTAALDAETEHQLFERYASRARERRRRGSITILVSHRFSTVRMADVIVVLDGAQVAESGTHDELMAARRPLRRAVPDPGSRLPVGARAACRGTRLSQRKARGSCRGAAPAGGSRPSRRPGSPRKWRRRRRQATPPAPARCWGTARG